MLSPLLANIALDGLEDVLASHYKVKEYLYPQPNGRHERSKRKLQRYGFVRYADDVLVTAETREDIEAILPTIEHWLSERGLELNREKTTITPVEEGVDYLGFQIRHFHGSCYTLPQREKVQSLLARIRSWLNANAGAKPATVLYTLNPLLRGWGNYYRHGVSARVFGYVDHHVFWALWRWARKRHPKKGKRWIAQKYFMPPHGRRWTFTTTVEIGGQKRVFPLVQLSDIPIERHVKVRGTASPDNPTLQGYWAARQTRTGKSHWAKGSRQRRVAESQQWHCPVCREHLCNGEQLQLHHKTPVSDGGTNQIQNLAYLHQVCHEHFHRAEQILNRQEA